MRYSTSPSCTSAPSVNSRARMMPDTCGRTSEVSKAVVNDSALQPGKDATAAIVFKVKPGFHAQSHTPTADYLIAFEV